MSCPIHEKDNFIENVYIVLSYLIKQCSFCKPCFDLHYFSQATVSIKISNFLICFCSFDLPFLCLKKIILLKMYIILCYLVLLNSVLF